jgi:arsenite transporter
MFALQGIHIVQEIIPVLRVTVPLIIYFSVVWILTMFLCSVFKFPFPIAVTQSFTAASNNFELALAVAVATYGVDSREALTATVGPLIEVPMLLLLVYLTPVVGKYYRVK